MIDISLTFDVNPSSSFDDSSKLLPVLLSAGNCDSFIGTPTEC